MTPLTEGQHPEPLILFQGWFEHEDSIHLVMEYIEHGDLGQYIRNHPAKAKAIVLQILEGLEVLHERGICHRDLKPKVRQQSSDIRSYKTLVDNSVLLTERPDCFSLSNLG